MNKQTPQDEPIEEPMSMGPCSRESAKAILDHIIEDHSRFICDLETLKGMLPSSMTEEQDVAICRLCCRLPRT